MGFWDAIVVIVLIVSIAYLRSGRYRSGGPADRALPGAAEPELEREITELRKRIAVLERIATDERKSRDIAAEIESLRD